jgi:hypothetical protein
MHLKCNASPIDEKSRVGRRQLLPKTSNTNRDKKQGTVKKIETKHQGNPCTTQVKGHPSTQISRSQSQESERYSETP